MKYFGLIFIQLSSCGVIIFFFFSDNPIVFRRKLHKLSDFWTSKQLLRIMEEMETAISERNLYTHYNYIISKDDDIFYG